jgi:hypothetical protein
MELNISELEDNFITFSSEDYKNDYNNAMLDSQMEYEKILFQLKLLKKVFIFQIR